MKKMTPSREMKLVTSLLETFCAFVDLGIKAAGLPE
jgi:hypothetical protein